MKKIFLLCFIMNLHIFANTETISLDFELTSTSINRALVSQFNDPNFVFHHLTGQFEFSSGQIVPYDIQLDRPTVEIDANSMGIHLSFSVSLPSLGFNYELDVTPEITIGEQSIKVDEVVAFIEDLAQAINSYQDIPQSVRDQIIDLYDTYEPQVYASSLYNEVLVDINSSDFISQRAFCIDDLRIQTSYDLGKLIINVLIDLEYNLPHISSKFIIQNNGDEERLQLFSNFKCTVRKIIIVQMGTSSTIYNNSNLIVELVNNTNPGYECNYSADMSLQNIVDDFIPTNIYLWNVLFETDDTFYYKQYKSAGFIEVDPYKEIN